MSAPRLASHVRLAALRRLVESEGGFATVLTKGDAQSGDILLILVNSRDRAAEPWIFQPIPAWQDDSGWTRIAQDIDNAAKLVPFLDKKRAIDPDLWVVELDIADRQRFAGRLGELI